MISSASSPFKLTDVKVHEVGNKFFPREGSQWYARCIFSKVDRTQSTNLWQDSLGVAGVVEIATTPWIEADKIGSSQRILGITALVNFVPEIMLANDEPTYTDALMFACREINPMLESATTLYGIKHNIDIRVEHGLRPTSQLLRNLTTPPAPGALRFNTKGR